MVTVEELEEAVASLQSETVAMRHIIKFLLVQRVLESPNALRSMAALFDTVLSNDPDGYTEHLREDLAAILRQAQGLADAVTTGKAPE